MLSTGAVFFYFYNRIKVSVEKRITKKKRKEKSPVGLLVASYFQILLKAIANTNNHLSFTIYCK